MPDWFLKTYSYKSCHFNTSYLLSLTQALHKQVELTK